MRNSLPGYVYHAQNKIENYASEITSLKDAHAVTQRPVYRDEKCMA
jgi:hypothetical protein